MSTKWIPSTCHCEALHDGRTWKLTQKCRTHDTFAQMKAHNNSFGTESMIPNRESEKRKQQFQRR